MRKNYKNVWTPGENILLNLSCFCDSLVILIFFMYFSKFESLVNQTDDDSCSLDSKLESKKKTKELTKLKKSVMVKNTSAMEVQALEEVTEQTLRVN